MSAPENPSAFPMQMIPEWFEGQPGMTLRDWFAGQALAHVYTGHETSPEKAAEWAFQLADAMLAARATGGAA